MLKKYVVFSRLPIKWKLTLWSSLLLLFLFMTYNAVQYVFTEQWMINREKTNSEQKMREVLNYFLENEVSFKEADYPQIRDFLEKINHQNQLIRVLDAKGNPVVSVSNYIPEHWISPQTVYKTEITGVRHLDEHLLVMRSPFTIFEFSGTVEIIKNTVEFERLITAVFNTMIVCGLGSVVLSGLGGRMLAGQLLKPLQSMAETMRKIKQKGLQERVQLNNSHDEISTLMIMFNEMMDQVERSFQQQKQFVEDASHELRTPIAIIEGHLSLLQRWGKNDPAILEESLSASIQELSRLKGLVQELLALSRAEKAGPGMSTELVKPEEAVRLLVRNVEVIHPAFQFIMELDAFSDVSIRISPQHLEQILLIVLDNAVKYSAESKVILIRGTVQQDEAVFAITDCGLGIPERDLPFIWDRFYRVDKARSREHAGYGLGLPIAKRLVEQYSGHITIQSTENKGTAVSVSFPVVLP